MGGVDLIMAAGNVPSLSLLGHRTDNSTLLPQRLYIYTQCPLTIYAHTGGCQGWENKGFEDFTDIHSDP